MNKFKTLFIAHTPDADKDKHRCVVETGLYQLIVSLVRSQEEAVEVAQSLVSEEGIHSILLCPGFTHKEVAEIQEAVQGRAGVFVARGDGPSSRITLSVMEKIGWFKKKPR